MLGPSGRFLFGTDQLGRDVLSRIIWGARPSLSSGVIAVAIASLLGTTLGLTAAYFGGVYDSVVSSVFDALLSFPGLILAILVIAFLGSSTYNATLAVAIGFIPAFGRVIRGSSLSIYSKDFVLAAKAMGAGHYRIIAFHLLRNVMPEVIVLSTALLGAAILVAASLAFLGLGLKPPSPSWGADLAAARPYMVQSPWLIGFPGAAIFVVVLAFNFVGDAMRDVLDPRLRTRGA